MNTLSWLIYAADISVGIAVLFNVLGTCLLAVGAGALVVGSAPWERYSYKHSDDAVWAELMSFRNRIRKTGVVSLFVGPLILLVGLSIPSTKTFYMIAASEVGETVVTSPETQEMLGDLKFIIKKRLKAELGE